MRLSALRSLFVSRERIFFVRGGEQTSDTMCRENAILRPPPRSGGGGPREAWWRGPAESMPMRAPRRTINRAQALRRALSPPEVLLWSRLRERAPGKLVFRRQHPMGPYVLDFYCAKARLAIELDGISHDTGDRPQRDLRRDAWLQARGITVMRIPVADLTRGIDEMADAIVRLAEDFALRPRAPSPALWAVPLPRFAGADAESRRENALSALTLSPLGWGRVLPDGASRQPESGVTKGQ
jgi:very-short-patch-repair endonuclease